MKIPFKFLIFMAIVWLILSGFPREHEFGQPWQFSGNNLLELRLPNGLEEWWRTLSDRYLSGTDYYSARQEELTLIVNTFQKDLSAATQANKETAWNTYVRSIGRFLTAESRFEGWLGLVEDVRIEGKGSNGNLLGRLVADKRMAVVEVSFAGIQMTNDSFGLKSILVEGFNGQFQPAALAIAEDDPLFNVALGLGKGQRLRISGSFVTGLTGDPQELRLLNHKNGQPPIFFVRYSELEPL